MKQNITTEQIRELNKGQRKRLTDYLKIISNNENYQESYEEIESTAITIGKMIEILNRTFIGRSILEDIFSNVSAIKGIAFKDAEMGWNNRMDLCDALWNGIKKVI